MTGCDHSKRKWNHQELLPYRPCQLNCSNENDFCFSVLPSELEVCWRHGHMMMKQYQNLTGRIGTNHQVWCQFHWQWSSILLVCGWPRENTIIYIFSATDDQRNPEQIIWTRYLCDRIKNNTRHDKDGNRLLILPYDFVEIQRFSWCQNPWITGALSFFGDTNEKISKHIFFPKL